MVCGFWIYPTLFAGQEFSLRTASMLQFVLDGRIEVSEFCLTCPEFIPKPEAEMSRSDAPASGTRPPCLPSTPRRDFGQTAFEDPAQ